MSIRIATATTAKSTRESHRVADLVIVKAFDGDGRGSYMDLIRGIDWVVQNKDAYEIRVLNLSFGAPPRSPYWEDPLNQAVMRAWQAGILVVVSAGNGGPDNMTINVPGNVPYVLTVGAMTDNYTPDDLSDDHPAFFTAAGPTFEGFPKPDLVAPGGHMISIMDPFSTFAREHPEFHDGGFRFVMSGSSQAAAVVSGVAALLLETEPGLTPDEVKCRLKATANLATGNEGRLLFSLFHQGSGTIDAARAIAGRRNGLRQRWPRHRSRPGRSRALSGPRAH